MESKRRVYSNLVWRAWTVTRAASFKLFSDFSFKTYLDNIYVKKYRQALSRLRLSSHRLAIETGRWSGPTRIPLDERRCQICDKLEDEYHFILECQLFNEFRQQYIKKYYWKRPNVIKFIDLLKSENINTVRRLAIYVSKCFLKRNAVLSA